MIAGGPLPFILGAHGATLGGFAQYVLFASVLLGIGDYATGILGANAGVLMVVLHGTARLLTVALPAVVSFAAASVFQ
ncbi:hypothetical protein [Novosphingobium naphthalenivorans]|nr:hypothetical protein [Novosphingobium naphthalenivorans]